MAKARPIKPSKKMSFRGKKWSWKVGQMIHWESLLERDYLNILEFDPNVIYFESQPLVIPFSYEGKKRRYFPDFKVKTKDNHIHLVEVKPKKFLKVPDNQMKFHVGQMYCEQNNWNFSVVTEEHIRPGYLQDNLNLIFQVRDYHVNPTARELILNFLEKNSESNLGELSKLYDDKAQLLIAIYQLIFDHKLKVDLINQRLNDFSMVTKNNKEGHKIEAV